VTRLRSLPAAILALLVLATSADAKIYRADGVYLNDTQTLTNKTLASPTITGVTTLPTGFLYAICANTAASSAVTGTASETVFSVTCKIPAGSINAAGHSIEVTARGAFTIINTDTLTIKIKACQVSGCASGTVVTLGATGLINPAAAVTTQGWEAKVDCNVFTSGAPGTTDCQGFAFVSLTGLTALQADDLVNTGTLTPDWSVDEYISVTWTFSSNSGTDSTTLRNFRVKIF
jgi:hypothetical protein